MPRAGFNGPASASQTTPSQAPARACPAPTRVRGSCCTTVVLADEWFRPGALAARTGVVSARHGHVVAGRAPHARHAPAEATTRQYAPPSMAMNGKLVEMPATFMWSTSPVRSMSPRLELDRIWKPPFSAAPPSLPTRPTRSAPPGARTCPAG